MCFFAYYGHETYICIFKLFFKQQFVIKYVIKLQQENIFPDYLGDFKYLLEEFEWMLNHCLYFFTISKKPFSPTSYFKMPRDMLNKIFKFFL